MQDAVPNVLEDTEELAPIPRITLDTRDDFSASGGADALAQGKVTNQQDLSSFGGADALAQADRNTQAQNFNPNRWMKVHSNGQVPVADLDTIGGGHYLRPDAAQAWKSMRRAAKKDGVNITLTDSYRDLATQERLAKEKGLYSQGGLAAQPGTSDHGWGIAVDAADGREWIAENGRKFGWVNDTPGESWHFGFKGWDGAKVNAFRAPRMKQPLTGKAQPTTLDLVAPTSPLVTMPMAFGSILGEVAEFGRSKRATPESASLEFVPKKFRSMFQEASAKYGVDARLLAAIAMHESGFDPKANSSAGAQGVMQVMPLHGLKNPYNAQANIFKGAEIFASYLNKAQGNLRLALAFYNAGPNADADVIKERMKLYSDPILETWRG